MPELDLSKSLKESGIEEIRILGAYIHIKHKITPQSPVEGSFEIKIKENPFETGKSLQRKYGKLLDPLLVQNLIVFITDNWEQIEIKSKSNNSEPEPFKPKYEFPTFEQWQISVEESYHKLHKTVNDNMKGAWPTFEFVLSILAILKIEEITLPFIGIILGPPSGIKTLILECLRKDAKGNKRRNTFFTHNFNAHSIISHVSAVPRNAPEGSQHMLLKMKNNIVLAPELAPIFTKKEEELREILGIITAVADGSGYESDTGFGHAGFAGQYFFVMAGAAVEIPWYAYRVLGQLGPKLFFFRLSEVNDTVEDYLDILEGSTFAARKHEILLALDEYHRHL